MLLKGKQVRRYPPITHHACTHALHSSLQDLAQQWGKRASLATPPLPRPSHASANTSSSQGTSLQFPTTSSASSLHCFGKGRCVWSLGISHRSILVVTCGRWSVSSSGPKDFSSPLHFLALLLLSLFFLNWSCCSLSGRREVVAVFHTAVAF